MNKLSLKIGSAAIAAAFMLSSFAVNTFASTDVTVSGNGSGSKNTVVLKQKCTTEVTQKNNTDVKFNVTAKANTGGNEIEGTTGDGDVSIKSGDATTTVGLIVESGENSATMPECCCSDGNDLTVDVSGNGTDTNNEVKSKKKNKVVVEQKSKTKVKAKVSAKSKTGKNEIKDTTGNGDVEISTGDATVEVAGSVTGGGNSL